MLRIRLWRLKKGLTQSEAGQLLGISHLTLGYLESGQLTPSARVVAKLERHFGQPASRLFEEVHDGLEVSP